MSNKFEWKPLIAVAVLGIPCGWLLVWMMGGGDKTKESAGQVAAWAALDSRVTVLEQELKILRARLDGARTSVVADDQPGPLKTVAMIEAAFRPKSAASKIIDSIRGGRLPRNALLFYGEEKYDIPGSFQVVFVRRHVRYTIWYSGSNPERPNDSSSISFWHRPNGTWDQESITTFADEGVDGVVDVGIFGRPGSEEQKEFFQGARADFGAPKGLAFAAAWQKRYDAAVKATLAALNGGTHARPVR